MSTFSTYVLFCLLCVSQASLSDIPWRLGRCSDIPKAEKLNVNNFFQGKWYVNNTLGDIFFQTPGSCLTSEMALNDEQRISILHYLYVPAGEQYVSVVGRASAKDIETIGSKFPVNYDLAEGILNFEIPVSVVATDYVNWAFMYFCKEHLLFKAEMAWAMTRERGASGFVDVLNQTAVKAGLELNKFAVVNNSNCREGEPHL